MLTLSVSLLFSAAYALKSSNIKLPVASNSSIDNDAWKSTSMICFENGYKYEEHLVTTSDGYILKLMRIPGKLLEWPTKKPAVLLQHGLEASADQWVINSADKAPAFNLVDQGFDVWMGNNRGNYYSTGHTTLNAFNDTDAYQYWDFDFEDMGLKDLPAFIDFIVNATGQSKIGYSGHSEGTTQFFIGASMNPTYFTQKINVFVALAPVAKIYNTPSSFLQMLGLYINEITQFALDAKYYQFFPYGFIEAEGACLLCNYLPVVCSTFLELTADLDTSVDNLDRINTYLTHVPAGAGWRNLVHYGQSMKVDRFQRFDWGPEKNTKLYGRAQAPLYPLQNINLPIGMFSGSGDEMADPIDVAWLTEMLGSNVIFAKQYNLGHMSFAIAKDMSFFQVDAIALFKKYATNTATQ